MVDYLAKHSQVCDPETVPILVEALNTAWAVVRTNGARYDSRDEAARNAVAKYIVDLALQGELVR